MRAGRVIRCACAAHVVENHFHYARRHAHPIAADLPAELIAIDCRAKGAQECRKRRQATRSESR